MGQYLVATSYFKSFEANTRYWWQVHFDASEKWFEQFLNFTEYRSWLVFDETFTR